MALNLNTALQNRQVDSFSQAFDNGATLKIYTGARPASGNAAATGTLLGTITLPDDPFAAGSSGVAALQGTWAGTGVAVGDAGWGRLTSADGTLICDGTVGVEFSLSDTSIEVGSSFEVTSFSLSQALTC